MSASAEATLFKHLVDRPDGRVDLATAALMIADVEYGRLDIASHLEQLDEWASFIRGDASRGSAGAEPSPWQLFASMRHLLFETLRFRGDDDDFFDLRNGFLSQVMHRKLGIPISLTVLVVVICERLELDIEVLGVSGNYFVRYRDEKHAIVIDPDDAGARVFDDELAEILGKGGRSWRDETIDQRQLVRRLLTHLCMVYARQSADRKHLAVIERLLLLNKGENEMILSLRDFLLQKLVGVN